MQVGAATMGRLGRLGRQSKRTALKVFSRSDTL